jgi:predicted ATPase
MTVSAIAGRYRLGECVGQGGMGTVFRGTDLARGSTVAIKEMRPAALTDVSSIERFRREGEALKRLNHPNIVELLEVVHEAGTHYLVMEFVAGGSLEDLIQSSQASLPIARVLSIALDLCDALTRTHRLEIIHRDIKPSNVLLTEDGTPKLTDFGAAYIAGKERITTDLAVIGTAGYVSPEALRGEDLDARADIWAFGVLLFELLTGTRPFARKNMAQTLHDISFASPPDLETLRPDCPPALVDLVYRMLAKDAGQRVPSVRIVGAELDKIARGQGGRARAESTFREARGGLPIRSNLPAETSTFVGRQKELGELRRCLLERSTRLVTIVGPGGMGKTRLSLELGQRLLSSALVREDATSARLSDGLFLVELAPLGSPDFIVSAIAEAAGFQFYPGRTALQQVIDHFRDKRVLLLLDNFEHLLDGAETVAELLRAAEGLTIVATSRERLGLTGETVLSLSGMEFPESDGPERAFDFSAIKLFVQAARQQKPEFRLEDAEAEDVVRICRLVHGVPLGIVIAGSWASNLSPREIADEISQSLDFLAAELRDLPERQRSMRAVFDHSWELLTEPERTALSAISIFRGGFTRDAAQAVAGTSIRVLATLINKSLLAREPGSGRYRLHELLRQYAEEKLHREPARARAVLDAHSAYFASYLEAREASLKSPSPAEALLEIETELDNVRAAWSRMLDKVELDNIERALSSLHFFHTRRAALAEGEAAFTTLGESLESSGETSPQRTRLLGCALSRRATFLRLQGRYAQAASLLDRALSLLDEREHPRERAFALVISGSTQVKAGQLQAGTELGEQALRLFRETGDAWGTAHALETLGRLYGTAGDFAKAERAYRESASIQRDSGMLESGSMGLGFTLVQQGDYAAGCQLMLNALEMFERAGDRWNRMLCQMNLANAQRTLGNYSSAEALARGCLEFTREIGNLDHEAWSCYQLGNVLKEQERYEAAAAQFQAGLERSLQMGDAGKIALGRLEFGNLALIRGDYREAERQLSESLRGFESAGQAWGVALALDLLGYLACQESNFELAQTRLSAALDTALSRSLYPFATNVVAAGALWFARTGNPERAVELLSFSQHHRATERHTVTRRIAPLLAELEGRLAPESFARAVERGKGLDWDDICPMLAPHAKATFAQSAAQL